MSETVDEIKKYTLDTFKAAKRVQDYVTAAIVDCANSDASCTQHGVVLGLTSVLVNCAKFADVARADLITALDTMYRQRKGEDISVQKHAILESMPPEQRRVCEAIEKELWTGDPNAN